VCGGGRRGIESEAGVGGELKTQDSEASYAACSELDR
jgi:hypothetical protein